MSDAAGRRRRRRASPGSPPRTGCARSSARTPRSSCWSSATGSAACCAPSTSRACPTTSAPRRSCARRPEVPRAARRARAWPTSWCTRRRRGAVDPRRRAAPCRCPAARCWGCRRARARLAGVLSHAGLARGGAPSPTGRWRWTPGGDVALGGLLRARFGDELADRLVDPLLGGVYAGRVDALGPARRRCPPLAAALDAGAPSLTARRRRRGRCTAVRRRVAAPVAARSGDVPSAASRARPADPVARPIASAPPTRCSAPCAAATARCSTPSRRRARRRPARHDRARHRRRATGWRLVLGPRPRRGARRRRGGARRARARGRAAAGRPVAPAAARRGGGHRAGVVRRRRRWPSGTTTSPAAGHVRRAGRRGRAPVGQGRRPTRRASGRTSRRRRRSCGCAPRSAGSARPRRCRPTTPTLVAQVRADLAVLDGITRRAGRRPRPAVGRRPAAVRASATSTGSRALEARRCRDRASPSPGPRCTASGCPPASATAPRRGRPGAHRARCVAGSGDGPPRLRRS